MQLKAGVVATSVVVLLDSKVARRHNNCKEVSTQSVE